MTPEQTQQAFIQWGNYRINIQDIVIPIVTLIILGIMLYHAYRNTTKREKVIVFWVFLYAPLAFIIQWGCYKFITSKFQALIIGYAFSTLLFYITALPNKVTKEMTKPFTGGS